MPFNSQGLVRQGSSSFQNLVQCSLCPLFIWKFWLISICCISFKPGDCGSSHCISNCKGHSRRPLSVLKEATFCIQGGHFLYSRRPLSVFKEATFCVKLDKCLKMFHVNREYFPESLHWRWREQSLRESRVTRATIYGTYNSACHKSLIQCGRMFEGLLYISEWSFML